MVVYALMDMVVGKIVPETLVASHNDEAMRRMLRDTVAGNHPVARHPEDYRLVALGTWELMSGGAIKAFEQPAYIGEVRQILSGSNIPLQEVD